uniref:Uncharacterized protein n=1 Tax=Anopheles atroparvus TaxID=41427 RepID=A0A182JLW2_ANOAO
MAFNQKNPPWQRNAGHQSISGMQAIVSFPQAQPVYNPNIGMQQQQNISILPQMGMQQQQALYSQTVQYPTNRPINAIGFQNQQQSQPTQSPVSQNSSKFNPNSRVFSGTGMVTKLQNDFGFIDDEVFFHKNTCVKGVIPKVGDRVLIDAAYNSNMPFKWNASRVQVLQSSNSSSSGHGNSSQVRSHSTLYSNASSHQTDSRSSNARNRYSPPPRKSPDRHMPRSSNSRSKDDYDESERRRKRDERDRDSDRSAPYREKHHEARSSERGRERERSPIRKPSPKRRRVRSVPRYMVQVPKHLLTIKQADVLELRRRYNNLYIPSDFFVSDIRWTEAFPPDASFSIRSPCYFHVMHKDVEPPALTAGGGDSGLDPPDADYLFSAKVMLMTTPPMAEFYDKCLPKAGADGGERYDEERDCMHPTRLISFLVGMRGKNETMAIGGPWSPSLDGADPQSDPTVLIRTAVRTCRALTGIDLSSCSQWYRFVELYYRRSESYHKGRLIPPRVETVVIFLPDVRSCQPTRLEWEQLRLSYKASLARVLNCSSSSNSSSSSVVDQATTKADPSPAVAQATPSASSTDDVTKSSTTSSSIAASSDAAGVVAEASVAASLVAPKQTDSAEEVATTGAVAAATADAGAAASLQQDAADGTAVVALPASSPETAAAAAVGAVSAENDINTSAAQPGSDCNTSGSSTQAAAAATVPAAAAAAAAAATAAVAVAATTSPAASIMDTTEGSSTTSDSAAELLLEYKKMKVAELKTELNNRNLPTDGIKVVLLSRLSEAVMEEHREKQQKAQQEAKQLSEVKQEAVPVEPEEMKEEPIEHVKMDTDAAAEPAEAMETDAEPPKVAQVKEEKPEVKEKKSENKEEKPDAKEKKDAESSATKQATKPGGVVSKAAAVVGEGEEVATKTEAKPAGVARKKEEPVKLSEKERQALERRYQLPEKPHILVHPSRVAKSGKFDCSVMSLSVLLDYRPEDTKEHSFEVALFSELFNEMLTRDFGFNIYRALYALPQAKKESEESKKDGSADGGSKSAPEAGGGVSNGEEVGKSTSTPASEKGDESKKKTSHADEKDRKRARHSETTDEERKSRDKDSGKGLLVNSDMLLSFVYFDVTHCGYMAEKDVEDLIYTLGLNLSRSQIRKTVGKGTVRELLHYRRLTDKVQAVPTATPQPEETVAPVDGAADADRAVESGAVAPDTETVEAAEVDEPQPEKEVAGSVARGNTDYKLQLTASLEQILNEQNGEGHPPQQQAGSIKAEKNAVAPVSATKTGIVEYNGCVVDVGKLLEQVKRTESAREETEKLLVSLQGQHAKLVSSNTRATSKIKDLQSENKTLTRQLSDSMRASRDAVQTQADYFAVIHHVYERVRPIVHKPSRDGSSSGGSSKRESSKETSSRAAVSKSKEKESSKDTATARKEDDKGTKEKGADPPAKGESGEGGGSNNDGGDEETTTATGGEQGSPEQTTPLAMETDGPNAAEKSATDGEQTS